MSRPERNEWSQPPVRGDIDYFPPIRRHGPRKERIFGDHGLTILAVLFCYFSMLGFLYMLINPIVEIYFAEPFTAWMCQEVVDCSE